MFSFVIEKKGKADQSVTGTYMNIIKEACESTQQEIEYIEKGQSAKCKDSYIVTDTIQSSLKYILKGYRNHIVWMQGIVPEESYMRNASKLRFKILGVMEKYILKKAKVVILVSNEMREHYEKKYKISLGEKSFVMPCFNETELIAGSFLQEKYDNNDFVYVGSLHKWQCFEQTVDLYSQIEKLSTKKTKFFVYTFQENKARELLTQYGIKNYEVSCVDKEQLSEHIKKIKYGFVLREDCAVNNVATPTKFSNYLANGIIPIYSSSLKSFNNYDQQNQIGIVYDINRQEKGIVNILQHMEEKIEVNEIENKCAKVFATYYNTEEYKENLARKIIQVIK